MQYRITLPADYDMGIIRERVRSKGALTDELPGLGFKAYLIRERGSAGTSQPEAGGGSPVNEYAPFYLWRTAAGMDAFLRGPGFRRLSGDFGRPAVHHWLGAGFRPGPAAGLTPRAATLLATPIAEDDMVDAVDRALGDLEDRPGLHSAAVAYDPYRWELLRFALWRDQAPESGFRYRVLHLSRPEFDALPTTED